MKAAPKKTLTSVILNLETEEDSLLQDADKWGELKSFSQILRDGIGTILIREKRSAPVQSSLASLLGFGASIEEMSKRDIFMREQAQDNEAYALWRQAKAEDYWDKPGEGESARKSFAQVKLAIEGECLSEVIYIEKPEKYSEISYNVRALVISNSVRNIFFCDSIELDYAYVQDFRSEAYDFSVKLQEYKSSYDLIIFDVREAKGRAFDLLRKYEAILGQMSDDFCYYVIVAPFAVGISQDTVLRLGGSAAEPESVRQLRSLLAPRQTWEYLNGVPNEKFVKAEKEFAFLFFYETTDCRRDEVASFRMLAKEESWNKLGNKLINMNIFFREIVFKLGKLPKFGA